MDIAEAQQRLEGVAKSQSTTEWSSASGLDVKALAIVLLDIQQKLDTQRNA